MLVLSRGMNNLRGGKFVAVADAASRGAFDAAWPDFIAFDSSNSVLYELAIY